MVDGEVQDDVATEGAEATPEEGTKVNGNLKWLLPLASLLLGVLLGALAALNLSASREELNKALDELHTHQMRTDLHRDKDDQRALISVEVSKALRQFRTDVVPIIRDVVREELKK